MEIVWKPQSPLSGQNPSVGEERKPLWPCIVALLIGLTVLYVAPFGPVARSFKGAKELMLLDQDWSRPTTQNTIAERMMMQATMTRYSILVVPFSEMNKRLTLLKRFMIRPRGAWCGDGNEETAGHQVTEVLRTGRCPRELPRLITLIQHSK